MSNNQRWESALSGLRRVNIDLSELPNDRNDSDSWNAVKRLAGLDDLELIALKNKQFPATTNAAPAGN